MTSTRDPRLNKSKWYKWEDMQGHSAQFVIETTSIENYAPPGKEEDWKQTLWLQGESKGFGLNVTNSMILETEWGDNEDSAWHGKVIELHIEQTTYEKKRVNCLRLYIPGAVHPECRPPQYVQQVAQPVQQQSVIPAQQPAPSPALTPDPQPQPPQEPEGFEMPPPDDGVPF